MAIKELPEELFRNIYSSALPGHNWDIRPSGKQFLMIKEAVGDTSPEETLQPNITIVLNWFEELKERVPVE